VNRKFANATLMISFKKVLKFKRFFLKVLVILLANTIVDPFAMMVEILNASKNKH
jgi:hypothetical protein